MSNILEWYTKHAKRLDKKYYAKGWAGSLGDYKIVDRNGNELTETIYQN